MKKLYALSIGLLLALIFFSGKAFAIDSPIPVGDFVTDVINAVKSFGGLSWALKISTVCMLIVASMKVELLSQYFWDKLGAAKTWVAPVLGLIGGLLTMNPITFAGALAYATAGLGANFLYELLDLAKVPAASNAIVSAIINIIQSIIKPKS
jgi:hypothetical protein